MTDVEAANSAVWGRGRRGVLELRERLERVGFVVGQGVIVLPAHGFLEPSKLEDGALYVPDEHEGGLALQVEVRLLDEAQEGGSGYARLIDRWEAYHGRRGAARFAVCVIAGARLGASVIDGDDLQLVNTLGNEGTLLRRLNADRAALARAVGGRLGLEVFEPLAVGVDQRGIDVRTRTGVLRVPMAVTAASSARSPRDGDTEAAAFVEALLSGGAERV
jgi:hypothetical protein